MEVSGFYVADDKHGEWGIYDARGMRVAAGLTYDVAVDKANKLNNPNIGDWNRKQLSRMSRNPNTRANSSRV